MGNKWRRWVPVELIQSTTHSPVPLAYYQRIGDLYQHGAGSAYEDPLDRDPERVTRDVKGKVISLESATKSYGVLIDPETLELNPVQTEKRRQEVRDERLSKGTRITDVKQTRKMSPTAKTMLRVHEYLEIAERNDGEKVICCIEVLNDERIRIAVVRTLTPNIRGQRG